MCPPRLSAAPPDDARPALHSDTGQVLTVEELAMMLRINRKTLYAAIGRGEVPGVRRIGGTIRISRDAVIAWLAEGQGRVLRSRRQK